MGRSESRGRKVKKAVKSVKRFMTPSKKSKKKRSPSPFQRQRRSPTPAQRKNRSPTPAQRKHRSLTPAPRKRRSQTPARRRKRRSQSPARRESKWGGKQVQSRCAGSAKAAIENAYASARKITVEASKKTLERRSEASRAQTKVDKERLEILKAQTERRKKTLQEAPTTLLRELDKFRASTQRTFKSIAALKGGSYNRRDGLTPQSEGECCDKVGSYERDYEERNKTTLEELGLSQRVFEKTMSTWTPEDDKELQVELKTLLELLESEFWSHQKFLHMQHFSQALQANAERFEEDQDLRREKRRNGDVKDELAEERDFDQLSRRSASHDSRRSRASSSDR